MVSVPAGPTCVASGAGIASATASSRASPAAGLSTAQNGILKPKAGSALPNGHANAPPVALSAMTSAPLDLTSVERRGQPTAPREPIAKKNRPYDLEEAPTYCPTEEEWKDPFEYINKIHPEAQRYGICKIIPPDSWNPDFAIDTEKFHFKTRKQELNLAEGSKPPNLTSAFDTSNWGAAIERPDGLGTRANLTYLDALSKFHKQHGNNLNRLPYVDKKPLDLYRLKKAVESRGGFDRVCKLKKWAEIGRDLGYSGKIMSSLSTSLKNSYQKWLCPYEEYLKVAKPGVHQQLELEYGGPLTPSPAPTPVKQSNVNTPSSLKADSPARQATDALQTTMNGHATEPDRDVPMADAGAAAAPPRSASGFTAINSGGFTAVNSGGFTSVNRPLASAESKPATPVKALETPAISAKNTPEYRPSGLGPANALKRRLSCDSSDSARKDTGTDKDDSDAGSRRSKRLKKDGVPTVAGSHMSLLRPPAPRLPRDESFAPGEKCEQCGKGPEAGLYLACESCDHAYHGACLDPPVKMKPEAGWNCARCLVGDGQFGFEEGSMYSLKQFQEKAAEFKQAYFESRMPLDALKRPRPVTEDDVEREFWRLVTNLEETVEVEYGADIHCMIHGSGFPTVEKDPDNPYSTDPWNLNILPLHPDSLFKYIKSDISGMTVPWAYVGMTFSTFCWHNEDHYAYSANYQHFGATKTWYGIPAEDADKFVETMREAVPELFETQPDLLFHLVTLLPPDRLRKAGVRLYALDQRAGQFVITFPQAYHAGFNHGFNFNEAVNFAPSDWEPFGLAGVERLQAYRKQPCFSHDELLWTAAEGITSGGLTIQTAKWLAPALERVRLRELADRDAFVAKHLEVPHSCTLSGGDGANCLLNISINDVDVPEQEYQCAYCKSFTFLSRFKCDTTGKVMCLQHAGKHQCCDTTEIERFGGKDHSLIYRKSEEAIAAAYKKVADKAELPQLWEDKYAKLLDEEDTPVLKTLRALLHEGEKIPYDLPSLPLLKAFVDRCNRWVDEATTYTIRKQQNRRKNEKAWQTGVRKSIGSAQQEQKEKETRNVSHVYQLLEEAEQIGFDCPEILQLQERSEALKAFQATAMQALRHRQAQTIETVEELLEEGHSFNVDIPEVDKLHRLLDQLRWNQKAVQNRGHTMTLGDVTELIEEGHRLEIQRYNDHMQYYTEQLTAGRQWEKKAQELMSADAIHYPQLEALSNQAQHNNLPVSQDTLAGIDQILFKHREAQKHVKDLNERIDHADYRTRPKYSEVLEVMKEIDELQSKPHGTLDLEREQRRHEDWMRRGKKLFGKTNAPLHILKAYLDYVNEHNNDCFEIAHDKPRQPGEPASRETSPDGGSSKPATHWEESKYREVFCICRRSEGGMMIECSQCGDWYHGKCLKIARGKVKDDDKFMCPICDWRIKIPRDAARPKLEDLVSWYEEIPSLPFQPEEEEVLKSIIDKAQEFRTHITPFCNPVTSTAEETDLQRFYLRKLEGAEILLAFETNFFRQELHKWSPVADQPPPVLEESKSTRKPRPTKLQKLLNEHGVDNPDDLPESVRGKANSLKRKMAHNSSQSASAPGSANSTGHGTATSPGAGPFSGGSLFSRRSSDQPNTPGLSIASSSHAHPSRGPDSSSSSAHGNNTHARTNSNGQIKDDIALNTHPSFFTQDGAVAGPQLLVASEANPNLSLEDRLLQGQMPEEVDMAKAIEILNRTEEGRRKAEELFGDKTAKGDGAAGATEDAANEGDVDRMFADMTNQDDEEDGKGKESKDVTMVDVSEEKKAPENGEKVAAAGEA